MCHVRIINGTGARTQRKGGQTDRCVSEQLSQQGSTVKTSCTENTGQEEEEEEENGGN